MTLLLTYRPDIGTTINGIELNWGSKKDTIRMLLNAKYEAREGRDIYENYRNGDNLFFLNYDDNNSLRDLEVHRGFDIIVNNVVLSFEKELKEIVEDLSLVSPSVIEIGDGEYFFKDLKLTIADSNAMGGEGNELAYFYCSSNVDHLIEE
jgi:hypothetical protein